jgi:hypothetical protein
MTEPAADSPVERLFHQAADLPLGARSAFLDAACGGDLSLRAEVESLLTCDQDTSPRNHLLDSPLLHRTASATANAPAFGPAATPGEIGTLGPYHIVKALGQGGMGAVYEAIDTRLGRRLALKVMIPQFAADPAARERFLREARGAAQVSHDNVVTVYEADERDGTAYIAMQLLEGCTLEEQMRKTGAPPLSEIFRIAREAADGLAAAHEIGLVHRDIKPNNLWLQAPTGRVKVLDFGLARPLDTQIAVTHTGAVIGTPAYMSPEQARGERLDHRTDLFSLGAVLYRLCSGRLPFEGPTTIAVLMALGMEDPPPLREINPSVPEPLAKLIHQMLAKKPGERPGSAAEVATRLRSIHVGGTEGSHDDAVFKRSSQGGRRMVGAIAVAVLLLTGGAIWISNEPAKQHEVGQREGTPATRPEVVIVATKPVPSRVVASDRDAAEWVLSAGGTVEIVGEQGEIANVSDLIDGHHFLNAIDLHGKVDALKNRSLQHLHGLSHLTLLNVAGTSVSDSDLASLSQCAELKTLWLDQTFITGTGLVHLTSLSKLEELHIGNAKLDDNGLSQLCKLTSLQQVFIQSANVSSKGIACLRNLPRLNHLDLYGSFSVGDEAVAGLKDCRLLKTLCVGSTGVSDKGLAYLKDLPELQSLNLIFNMSITNEGLAHLRNCTHLTALDLFGTRVGDAGMAAVASIATLKELELDRTEVTDKGLVNLQKLSSLTVLHLNKLSGVTDEGLAHLEQLKTLRSIQVANTGVTLAGLKRFHAALPECKIEQEDGAIAPAGSVP